MIEVVVFRNIATMGHTMYMRDKHTGHLLSPQGTRYNAVPGAVPPPEAAWNIPDGAEHAMLGALSQALGAVEHPQQLREDYLAERARVDKFIEMLRPRLVAAGWDGKVR